MTTTTAQAGEVMSRLEFLLQTAWTDLRGARHLAHRRVGRHGGVRAQVARGALSSLSPAWTSPTARCPTWAVKEFDFDGVPIRLSGCRSRASWPTRSIPRPTTASRCGSTSWSRRARSASSPTAWRRWRRCASRRATSRALELDNRNTLYDLGLGKMAAARQGLCRQGAAAAARAARRPSAGAWSASKRWTRTRGCAAAPSCSRRATRWRATAAATSRR